MSPEADFTCSCECAVVCEPGCRQRPLQSAPVLSCMPATELDSICMQDEPPQQKQDGLNSLMQLASGAHYQMNSASLPPAAMQPAQERSGGSGGGAPPGMYQRTPAGTKLPCCCVVVHQLFLRCGSCGEPRQRPRQACRQAIRRHAYIWVLAKVWVSTGVDNIADGVHGVQARTTPQEGPEGARPLAAVPRRRQPPLSRSSCRQWCSPACKGPCSKACRQDR